MNPQQARQCVAETFLRQFDKNKYIEFNRNVLNKFDESKAQAWNSTHVKDMFKKHISRFECLGTYISPDGGKLDVLVVHLTSESKLERTRTAIRNFVADYLKTRDEKEAALVAFVSPTERQWRFSYIKMEYAAIQKDDGKVGVETRLTPARRFSYIVGEGESCHTAQTRFLGFLQDTDNNPTLSKIEEAFSVETVSKEFYEQYRDLFERVQAALEQLVKNNKVISDEFKKRNLNSIDFSKKLMGQIVFLYFLQKKGWLGVAKGQDWGTGPQNFLRRLANGDYGRYNNFHHDMLEPLFYDSLADDRGHAAWCSHFKCRIPFLNGGLFEPLGNYDWRKVNIALPNELFTNTDIIEHGITGTGILDVFDRYNFTVNEAEPLEKEVAIDPEMLGKVFENLIEDNRRKGLGSYYTPREIVHYMCQESLINYLETALSDVSRTDIETFIHSGEQISQYDTMPKSVEQNARKIDKIIADITVCDPAVGSGAFPVGMMTEIVRARSVLTPYFNDPYDRTPYHFKRHAIQNCLYGVDIDPGAVEIAKLRLWLSLVVDEEDVKQIKPLPNLLYKIVTGNSLLSVDKTVFNEGKFQQLEELKPRYFDEPDKDKKNGYKQQIDAIIHELTNGKETFDFEIYFSEVYHENHGFDVVIANPPYVRQEKIKELKPALKNAHYECYSGTADLLVYFYECGVKLLRAGGAITLITSNKYYRAGYGKNLRRFLVRELTLRRLIDFGDAPVFEAIAYASILEGVRIPPVSETGTLGYTWEKEIAFDRITQVVPERGQLIRQSELRSDGWSLESPSVLRLIEKLRSTGKPLGEYVNGRFYYGIKTGLNEAFVVNQETRDCLIRKHKSCAEILKPYLRGRDVKRWHVDSQDLWLIFTRRGIDIAKYPSIYEHLLNYKNSLIPMPDDWDAEKDGEWKGRKAGSYEWYEIQDNIAYWQEFEKPKIIIPAIANNVEYALDYENYYSNDKTSICIAKEPEYLAGLLNSRVLWWFIRQTAASKQGGFYEFKPMYVSVLPIPIVSSEKQKLVEMLVERINLAKQSDAGADVSMLEDEIDKLVYTFYSLTEDERTIVQAVTK